MATLRAFKQEGLLLLGVKSIVLLLSVVAVFDVSTTTRGLTFIVSSTHLGDGKSRTRLGLSLLTNKVLKQGDALVERATKLGAG